MPIQTPPHRPSRNMVEHLRMLARERPTGTALIAVSRDGETRFDYAALDLRARALAAELQDRFEPGDRALLLLDNDQHYVTAFFACLYAGLIAVPVFPPESTREQHLARLAAIAADCKAACVLASAAILELVGATHQTFAGAVPLAVDSFDTARAEAWREHEPKDEDIAFLQYTSGSTAAPKGVMVSHANLMANERAIEEVLAVRADDVFVTWLPLFHDMGLIGGLLQPMHRGIPVVLMSPGLFLERPVRWLEAIARHRGTISGGPDFAYRLCVERVKPAQLEGLDLSSWRLAFSGSEPVRHDTLQAFVKHFAPAGFAAEAVYPCYGLAEATLLVTGGRRGAGMTARSFSAQSVAEAWPRPDAQGGTLVACGGTPSGHQVEIVEPTSLLRLAEGQVGEIWASGPSIAQGYWRNKEASAATFVERDGRRWLRTGDLGFLHEGQLYIAGRHKDLIILRGQNVYPQDIERAIEAEVEAVRKGRVAAFAVRTPDGGEGVGVAVEVPRGLQKLVPCEALVEALGQAVSAVCREPVAVAVLLNPGALPRTSSGKLQRQACSRGWRDRTLDAYAIHEHGRFVVGGGAAAHTVASQDDTEAALAALWQQVLKRYDGTGPLGREAHFFASGGNSLAAVQLAARIGDRWEIDFPIRLVFEHPRLLDAAAAIKRLLASGARKPRSAIPALPSEQRAGPWPLSHAQQRQWFLWQLDPQGTAYHISGALRLTGALDTAALRDGVGRLVARHESLRTVFRAGENGVAEQVIQPPSAPDVALIDLRDRPTGEREEALDREVRRISAAPFDLTRGPLVRVALIRVAGDAHVLLAVMHHIVSDGASMQIFIDELAALYLAGAQGAGPRLADLPIRYTDYAAWQRGWLAAGERDRQLAYWKGQLGDEHPVLRLPCDYPRRVLAGHRAARHSFALPAGLLRDLRRLAEANGASLFMALLAGFQALLHRCSGQEDIRVGVPVANRHRAETEGLIGFFVNTLVLRNTLHGRTSFAQVLAQAKEAALGAQAHQDLPFEQLVEALQPERSLDHSPLFQVMFNHLSEDFRSLEQLPGLTLERHPLSEQAAQFELVLDTVERHDGQVAATLSYAAELFEPASVERFAGHYLVLLQRLAAAPAQAVGDVSLLGGAEQAQLRAWGVNERRYPNTEPVHRLIERQVAQRPDATALVFGNEALSYAELNQRANRLAHRLIELGVKPETKVGLAVERSIGMVVGLLAVLKAGGACVPLDPQYPPQRLSLMIEDSGIELLLTQSQVTLPQVLGLKTQDIDTIDARLPQHNPDVALHPHHLAYVIYTSGSTGQPKGIGVAHHALAEHSQAAIAFFGLTPADRVLQFSTINFDVFVEQLLVPLAAGAAVVLRGPELWDSDTFHRELLARRISIADLTPAYWFLLAQDFARRGLRDYGALRQVHVGGESMPPQGIAAWREAGLGHVKLLNAYGPTEATVTASVLDCTGLVASGAAAPARMPIGRPLPGRGLHVVDADLNPVPLGVAGELCISGGLLARGYVHRPSLTAERFVADPFDEAGGRLYRTGDQARWRSDGQLEYLGRLDDQVKIRGQRIEPGEVEARLLEHAEVREAVVMARPGPNGQQLVAYVSSGGPGALDAEALRRQLGSVLPAYMVPGAIVVLAALPRGSNGKLDKKALPEPGFTSARAYEAPQGDAEAAMAALWAEVLGTERVGRHDNFFELGGHSLAVIQVTALLAQRHGVEVPVRRFFEHPTVAAISADWPAQGSSGAQARRQRLSDMDRLLNEFEA